MRRRGNCCCCWMGLATTINCWRNFVSARIQAKSPRKVWRRISTGWANWRCSWRKLQSAFLADHLDQGLDIPEREGKCLMPARIASNLGNVVGHDHPVVAYLFVHAHGGNHVDVTVVWKRFLKVQKTASDVSEMDVENFAPRTEITNYIKDLARGIRQHL